MKQTLFLCLVLLFASSINAQTQTPEAFLKKVNDAKAVFIPSPNTEPIPVIKNKLVHYDYAFKVKGKNVEVRYIIWPFTAEAYAIYNNREKKDGDSVLHPDRLHRIVGAQLFNRIAGDTANTRKVQLQKLNSEGVKKDFGADHGGMYMGLVAPDFAKDYKFGFFMLFHKDNAGDIYVLYLFNDQEAMFKEQQEITNDQSIFKAIRFK